MIYGLVYLALGAMFVLWAASYHHEETVRPWEWLVGLAVWPLCVVGFVVLVARIVQKHKSD